MDENENRKRILRRRHARIGLIKQSMNIKLNVQLRKLIYIAAGCVIAFIAVQFVRPQLTNPPVTADLVVPPQVKQILRNSCYDCHSNETKLLWFDRVVPAYWIVAKDIKLGRKHLNFSELGRLPPAQQKAALYEGVAHVMIKDSKKYASTLGWGFARWRGTDLQPYGKSAGFTSECVGCHTFMGDNDFVFTQPIRGEQ